MINGKQDAFVYDLPYNAIFASQNQGAVVHPTSCSPSSRWSGPSAGDQDTLQLVQQLPAPDQGRRQLRPSLGTKKWFESTAWLNQLNNRLFQWGGMPPFTQTPHTITTKEVVTVINPKLHKTDGKQPNQLLWHGIFLLLVLAAIFGIYKAVQAVDYTWRWERIPSTSPIRQNRNTHAEFDGTVVADKGQLFLQDDLDPSRRQAIAPKGSQLAEGDTVFLGDTLDVQLSWTAGPIAWGSLGHGQALPGGGHLRHPSLAPWLAACLSPIRPLRNLAVTYGAHPWHPVAGADLHRLFLYRHRAEPRPIHRWWRRSRSSPAPTAEIVRAGISSIHNRGRWKRQVAGMKP